MLSTLLIIHFASHLILTRKQQSCSNKEEVIDMLTNPEIKQNVSSPSIQLAGNIWVRSSILPNN